MEPEINTLTPENPPKSSSNRILYFVFGFLLLAIIALVVAIIIVNNQPTPESDQPIATETITNPEGLKMGEEFQTKLSSLTEEATKLLDENPQNADKVQEIFANVISEYSGPGMAGYARTLVDEEIKLLLSHNLTEKAYEIYNQVDSYIPDELDFQNGLYSDALDLAKKENNQSWADIFQAKFDATMAAKQSVLESITQYQNEYDAKIQQMVDEDNRRAAERKNNSTTQTEEK